MVYDINNKSDNLFIRSSGRNGRGNNNFKKFYKDVFGLEINFDETNNNRPTQLLGKSTLYKKNKNIFNYQISHVFGNTKNVFCFIASWNLINAMVRNDLLTIENILITNITSMTVTDKRLVMNFAINYSSGENTLRVCQILINYNICPNAFDLYTAINRNRQNSTIQFLLQNGAVPNGEILLLTMEKQRFDPASLTLFLAWNTIKICGKSNIPMNLESGGRR